MLFLSPSAKMRRRLKLGRESLILGVESSCDDTSVSVLRNGREILSNVVSSQDYFHGGYGGVFPEMAAREHIKNIEPTFREAIGIANVKQEEITAIAVTYGPGLIGSLVVGLSFAKGLSLSSGIPLVPVHHLEGHIYASFIDNNVELPAIALIASGGHTSLIYCDENHQFSEIGATLDDAVGEAYDKVARMLNLGFPGGPIVDKLSQYGNDSIFKISSSVQGLNFSFSGPKSMVYRYIENNKGAKKEDICASFQKGVINILVDRVVKASDQYGVKSIILGGGVAANSLLREKMEQLRRSGKRVYIPAMKLCLDNGAMIAAAAYHHILNGKSIGNRYAISREKIG